MSDRDDALLRELTEAGARIDPVPAAVTAAARAAFAWRTIDSELAALSYDSVLDTDALAGVRSSIGSGPRQLTFTVGVSSVECEIVDGPDGRHLLGQLVPATVADVVLDHADGAASAETRSDELGRFELRDVPTGPVRLRILPGDGREVITEWVAA